MLYQKMDDIEKAYKNSAELLKQAESLVNKGITVDVESYQKEHQENMDAYFAMKEKQLEEIKAVSDDLKASLKSDKAKVPSWVYLALFGSLVVAFGSLAYSIDLMKKNTQITNRFNNCSSSHRNLEIQLEKLEKK